MFLSFYELQGFMARMNFYYILVAWLISSVDPQVIVARLGSTAVLPCNLNSTLKPSMYIQWRTDYTVVFERGRKDSYQGDRYKGRVDVSEMQLRKRNCSLVLKDVWINDAGVYYTYLFEKRSERSVARFIQRVKLDVYVDAETNVYPLYLTFSFILSLLYFLYYMRTRKVIIKMKKGYDL